MSDELTRELELDSNGVVLKLRQEFLGDVGCVVWDSALALAKYLDHRIGQRSEAGDSSATLKDKTIVELGTGTGCVGLAAAALGAKKVFLTDLEEFLDLCRSNVAANDLKAKCCCAVLDWKSDAFPAWAMNPEIVLFSDCIYYEEALEPLMNTIRKLCRTPMTEILMSYEDRSESFANHGEMVQRFFSSMGEHFVITEIPEAEQHPDYRSPEIRICRLRRKP